MTPTRGEVLRLGAGAALAGALAPRAAAAQELHTVRVLAVPADGIKSTLYAQKAGLFKKHGITVDVQPMSGGAAIFAAVAGGSADVGSGSLYPVFNAYARGLPLRILAPASLYLADKADAYLFVRKEAGIKTARDLNGKVLGCDSVKDVNTTATRYWVDKNGGDGRSLKVLELKRSEMLPTLLAGRIDGVVLESPFFQTAMANPALTALCKPLDAVAPRFLLSCWVTSVDFVTKYPDVAAGYVAALAEAAKWTNANQAATIPMVAQFTGLDPALIAKGERSITAESFTAADVQPLLDLAVKYGVIDKPFDVNGLIYRPK